MHELNAILQMEHASAAKAMWCCSQRNVRVLVLVVGSWDSVKVHLTEKEQAGDINWTWKMFPQCCITVQQLFTS